MDDLVKFLRDRLDEDAKRQHGPDDWHARDCDSLPASRSCCGTEDCDCDDRDGPCNCGAPARVLADVEVKRELVKLHEPVVLRGGAGARYFDTTTVCRSCEPPRQFPENASPCPTLRVLALPYAGHEAYRVEWRP